MKVSYFETGRYVSPPGMPREWPVPAGSYDLETGAEAYRGMVERVRFVEELGFDWVSVSEHHYSPRILTPAPVVSATYLASRVDKIKIALLGPIVPTGNPIQIAEEKSRSLSAGRAAISSTAPYRSCRAHSLSRIPRLTRSAPAPKPAHSPRATTSASGSPTGPSS